MSVTEIEAAISQLPSAEVTALMAWLANHHAQLWDQQIADDLDSGKSPAPVRSTQPRPFGLCAGEFTVPDHFNDPLPDEMVQDFERA